MLLLAVAIAVIEFLGKRSFGEGFGGALTVAILGIAIIVFVVGRVRRQKQTNAAES